MNTTNKLMAKEQTRIQPWSLQETGTGWYSSPSSLETLAKAFEPISLKQMDSVALLNRTDTKFVMSTKQLLQALEALQQDYWMLSVQGQRFNHYRTLYFDSQNFEFYNLHVNGRANRYKVRSREYTDTSLSFLEVKHKTSKDRTIKQRIATSHPVVRMTRDAAIWLQGILPYESSEMEPKLWNTFTRITLVSKLWCERVTLDTDLTFSTEDKVIHLDGVAIAEVKTDRCYQASPFITQMRTQRIYPQGFSKYCIGVSLLYTQVKKNSMKPKLLWLEKISRGTVYHD